MSTKVVMLLLLFHHRHATSGERDTHRRARSAQHQSGTSHASSAERHIVVLPARRPGWPLSIIMHIQDHVGVGAEGGVARANQFRQQQERWLPVRFTQRLSLPLASTCRRQSADLSARSRTYQGLSTHLLQLARQSPNFERAILRLLCTPQGMPSPTPRLRLGTRLQYLKAYCQKRWVSREFTTRSGATCWQQICLTLPTAFSSAPSALARRHGTTLWQPR